MAWFKPKTERTREDVRKGLRLLLFEGVSAQVLGALTGGAFLVAFALSLGASNKVIGLLAAIGPFTQLLQIPAIFLVDRLRLRKVIVLATLALSRLCWVGIALVPLIAVPRLRIPVFLVLLLLFFGLGSIAACAFNSWMRDFIPDKIMGRYFSRRMAISTAAGALISILAAIAVDLFSEGKPLENGIYGGLFVVGAIVGLVGLSFFICVPEPTMHSPPARGLFQILKHPFENGNFRALLVFLGLWNFAVNLAAPFFTVFLLREIKVNMAWVLALSVLSQTVNVVFLRIWGRLADRFSNKSILAVSGPLFMISIIMWPFTTMPDVHTLTIPLVIAIHVLGGISTAGVTLCAGNIAMVSAPKGEATAYLAVNALVSGIAATLAPLMAGVMADWFADKELGIDIHMGRFAPKSDGIVLYAINLRGLDFLFLFSFLFGLYALERLVAVHEPGHVKKRVVVNEFYGEVRKMVRHVSNVAGLRQLTYFPYSRLRDLISPRPRSKKGH